MTVPQNQDAATVEDKHATPQDLDQDAATVEEKHATPQGLDQDAATVEEKHATPQGLDQDASASAASSVKRMLSAIMGAVVGPRVSTSIEQRCISEVDNFEEATSATSESAHEAVIPAAMVAIDEAVMEETSANSMTTEQERVEEAIVVTTRCTDANILAAISTIARANTDVEQNTEGETIADVPIVQVIASTADARAHEDTIVPASTADVKKYGDTIAVVTSTRKENVDETKTVAGEAVAEALVNDVQATITQEDNDETASIAKEAVAAALVDDVQVTTIPEDTSTTKTIADDTYAAVTDTVMSATTIMTSMHSKQELPAAPQHIPTTLQTQYLPSLCKVLAAATAPRYWSEAKIVDALCSVIDKDTASTALSDDTALKALLNEYVECGMLGTYVVSNEVTGDTRVYWMVPKKEDSKPQALVTTGHKRSGDSTSRPLSTLAKKKPRMLLTKRQQQQEEKATSSVVSKSTSSKPGTGTPAAAILATLKKPLLARQRQLLASLKPIRDARRQLDTVVRYRSEDADAKLSALASTWRKAARGIAEALRDSVIARTGGGGDGDENGAATGMFHIRGGTGRSSQRANATATSFNPFDYDPEGTELAEAQEEERRRKEAEEEEDFYSRPTAVRFTMKLLLESMGVDIASLVGDEDGCSYDEEADCFE